MLISSAHDMDVHSDPSRVRIRLLCVILKCYVKWDCCCCHERNICLHVVPGVKIGHCSGLLVLIHSSGKRLGSKVFVAVRTEHADGVEAYGDLRSCFVVASVKV
jgi:hypothetical protein